VYKRLTNITLIAHLTKENCNIMKASYLHRPIQAVNIYTDYVNGNRRDAFDTLTSTADYKNVLDEVLEHFTNDQDRIGFVRLMFIHLMETK